MNSKIFKLTDNFYKTALAEGTVFEKHVTIEDDKLAVKLGSNDIKILSTAGLIAIIEQTCFLMVSNYLLDDLITVSAEVNFKHIHPVKVGDRITAQATLKFIEGNILFFDISILDKDGVTMGVGAHERYIVHGKGFVGEKNPNI